MSSFGSYELTHPELLSEYQLLQLLSNSCIDTLNLRKLRKIELLEMYKLISMPLPQRQRGKVLNIEVGMASGETDIKDNTYNLNAGLSKGTKRTSQLLHFEEDRLKPIVNDPKSMYKKIILSCTPKVEATCNGINKRRCDEQNEESVAKKRQKITWP